MAKAKTEAVTDSMEQVNKNVELPKKETPRWQQLQNENIERAARLIKENGPNVEFLVIKDKFFLAETVKPIENIDEAMDFLYRLEGRGINSEDIQKFRSEYQMMCDQIKLVESLAVEYLAAARVKTTNFALNRKIRDFRKKDTEPKAG